MPSVVEVAEPSCEAGFCVQPARAHKAATDRAKNRMSLVRRNLSILYCGSRRFLGRQDPSPPGLETCAARPGRLGSPSRQSASTSIRRPARLSNPTKNLSSGNSGNRRIVRMSMAIKKGLTGLVVSAVVVGVGLTGCGGRQTSTVQGRVIFQVGGTRRSLSNGILQLKSGSAVVATQRVSPTGTYHFTVDPGTYSFDDLSHSPCSGTVSVRAGQTIHHDVICKPALAVEGVIAGVASPCIGFAVTSSAQVANIPVTVRISADGKTIATQTVTGSHNYKFVVAPGLYEVSSGGEGSLGPLSVAVRSGETLRVNIPSNCL